MGTKSYELEKGCFAIAMDDEPMFVLLARDPAAPFYIREWAEQREADIHSGLRPAADFDKVREALQCADNMERWRTANYGAWRTTPKKENGMNDHKGLPVAGYKDQKDKNVAVVNVNKELEERVLRQIEKIKADPDFDPRMVAVAFTGIQDAFMWLNRAVFQPTRVKLPEDAE